MRSDRQVTPQSARRQSREDALPAPPPLLITRPATASGRFAVAWKAKMGGDVRVVIAPVVTLEALPGAPSLENFAGVVFTSEAAVAALNAEGKGLRAWCVGGRTATAARARGFDATAGGGDADALVASIVASGETGPLLHARGREVRGDVAARLRAAGVDCAEHVVYVQRSRPLSPEALALLAGDEPVLVPVFSPNSAARLGTAAADASAPLLLAAMSAAVAEAWTGPVPRALEIAARPDAAAMIEALARLASRLEAGERED